MELLYHDVHENAFMSTSKSSITHMFKYISHRLDTKVEHQIILKHMNNRQEIYEKIYQLEVRCHGGSEIQSQQNCVRTLTNLLP